MEVGVTWRDLGEFVYFARGGNVAGLAHSMAADFGHPLAEKCQQAVRLCRIEPIRRDINEEQEICRSLSLICRPCASRSSRRIACAGESLRPEFDLAFICNTANVQYGEGQLDFGAGLRPMK